MQSFVVMLNRRIQVCLKETINIKIVITVVISMTQLNIIIKSFFGPYFSSISPANINRSKSKQPIL